MWYNKYGENVADIVVGGIDSVTGQMKPLSSSDSLVDSSGNAVLPLGETVYSPTCAFPVNGSYNTTTTQNRVFGVYWGSRFGGGICGPINTDSQDNPYPGGVYYAPEYLGTSGVGTLTLSGLQYPYMICSTRVAFNTVQMPMWLPVPSGATAISQIQVYTQVAGSTLITSNSSLTLLYNPLNGGASKSANRTGIGSNDGSPVAITIAGPIAAPTPGHHIRVELQQNFGVGEGGTPTGPYRVAWLRLAITWA
jgi:hypothetical protein